MRSKLKIDGQTRNLHFFIRTHDRHFTCLTLWPRGHLQLWVAAPVDLPILPAEVLVNLIFHHVGSTKGLQPLRGRRLHLRRRSRKVRGKQEQQISMPVQTTNVKLRLSSFLHNLSCTEDQLTQKPLTPANSQQQPPQRPRQQSFQL